MQVRWWIEQLWTSSELGRGGCGCEDRLGQTEVMAGRRFGADETRWARCAAEHL